MKSVVRFFIIIAVLAVFFIIVTAIDCNRFVIKEYTCSSKKLKQDVKAILLSDLHDKSYGRKNEKLLKAIEKEAPDIILIAGDMYTCVKNEDNSESTEFVCRLAEKYPVYCGNGNHEHKTRIYPDIYGDIYESYSKKIKEAGALLLIDEKVLLPAYNIALYGVEIEQFYYRKFADSHMEISYLEEKLGKAEDSCFNLLIAHNPDYFETYAGWGADLTVSGHVHGGLMVLPYLGGVVSPRLTFFPKYDGGKFESGGKEMVLSRGLGMHTLPIRIFNPGELVVIHLKSG